MCAWQKYGSWASTASDLLGSVFLTPFQGVLGLPFQGPRQLALGALVSHSRWGQDFYHFIALEALAYNVCSRIKREVLTRESALRWVGHVCAGVVAFNWRRFHLQWVSGDADGVLAGMITGRCCC